MIHPKKINLLFALCCVLLSIRLLMKEDLSFLFLYWNLFLAWIPYLAIRQLTRFPSPWYQGAVFVFSFLFLPNAPYIVTDLFHFKKELHAPMWFDLILLLSFSLLGMIYFLLTLQLMLHFLKQKLRSEILLRAVKFGMIFLCSYGIYLGRFLRLNSWDILYPKHLLAKIYESLLMPELGNTLQITLTFSAFLYVLYEITSANRSEQSDLIFRENT